MRQTFRLDSPGTLHHVISRAVDGRMVFSPWEHANDFIQRLGKLVLEGTMKVHAWTLMGNHFHLLAEPCTEGLSVNMQRLLTGFAARYNLREERQGHVFQGRFTSILVETGDYLLELIRYIHLNPLRAGIVRSLDELSEYPYSGHLKVVRSDTDAWDWYDAELIRSLFSDDESNGWKSSYLKFLKKEPMHTDIELEKGTFILGSNGVQAAVKMSWNCSPSAMRILGSRQYAGQIYENLRSIRGLRCRDRMEEHSLMDAFLKTAADVGQIPRKSMKQSKGSRRVSKTRAALVRVLTDELGLSNTDVSGYLRVTPSAITAIMRRDPSPEELILINAIKRSNKYRK